MKRSIILLALWVMRMNAAGVSLAAGKGANPAKALADAKSEVLQAEESRNRALEKGDADALAKLYTDDLIYTNALGLTLTKSQHLADIRSRKLQLTTLKHRGVQVRMHGDAGFVTGVSTSLVNFHGNVSENPRKFLNVYVKENGVWRCAVHVETPAAKQ